MVSENLKYYWADFLLLLPECSSCKYLSPNVLPHFVKVIKKAMPVDESYFTAHTKRQLKIRRNCCGWQEYFKLSVWTLTQYEKVLFIDNDIQVMKNIDWACKCKEKFLYTSDRFSPLNAGIFVTKPSFNKYEKMKHMLKTFDYNRTTGWNGNGYLTQIVESEAIFPQPEKHGSWSFSIRAYEKNAFQISYGADGPQGFLFHFWEDTDESRNTAELDPCLFNSQGWSLLCPESKIDLCDTYVVHKIPARSVFKFQAKMRSLN